MDTPIVATSSPVSTIPVTSTISVTGNVVYASFLRRFVALLVDAFIIGLVSLVVIFILNILLQGNPSGAKLIAQFINPLISFGYYIYFIGSSGQTPGKKALGIKVVTESEGKAPGYMRAFIRETIGKILSSLVFLLGYFWVIWDGKKQAWHDKIAGTVVIKLPK